ncbi:MAG TPA: hypothetical protein VGZ00_04630, partial [Candidatus Baltobacteraceae bacterium]|nr:hypothetical protein [Candidatus Baltobacteraceae bacterium]
ADLVFRVFNTAPYAIVSGMRDMTTVIGKVGQTVGDTGGNVQELGGSVPVVVVHPTPNPSNPSAYTDTTVHAYIHCVNVTNPFDPQDPRENDGLPWDGVQGKAYGLSCAGIPAKPFFPLASPQPWVNGSGQHTSGQLP